MAQNWIDRVVNYISPERGAKRIAFRNAVELAASYKGAIATRNATPWSTSESMSGLPHLNQAVQRSMRDRARSLVENNPLASSILNRSVENIIGNGLQVQALSDDPAWNEQAESLMREWFPYADFHGRSWIQHQKLVATGLLRDGDVGGALLSKGQVQLVESDYISSPYTKTDAYLHDGVELDTFGRAVRYYIMTYLDLRNKEWRPVAAKDLLFVANMRRGAQYRGETYFAQSFSLFDSLDGYLNAVVLAQKIAACLAVFIRKNDPTGAVAGLGYGTNSDGKSQRQMTIEPGMIQTLGPGEDISQINPSQPGAGFSENIRMFVRLLGLSFGLPIEYALLDFTNVSGNTSKASALAAQRSFEAIQRLLMDEYFTPLYRWRISKFIKEGKLEDREDKFAHRWHAEPWPYLDPVKELQAVQLEIDTGLTTLRRQITARGGNPDQVITERAAEVEKMRGLNLPIYHSGYVMEQGTATKESTPAELNRTEESTGDVPPTELVK